MTTQHPAPESDLPPELIAAIAGDEWAALTHETDDGQALQILKAPGFEIAKWQGSMPISTVIALYDLPSAPVVRLLTGLYEDPDDRSPTVLFESFLNVADEDQRRLLEHLTRQEELRLRFYDESHQPRLMKVIPWRSVYREQADKVLGAAIALQAAIPIDSYDFDRAKASVLAEELAPARIHTEPDGRDR